MERLLRPLLYLGENPKLWTLSLGLSEFRGSSRPSGTSTMAASVLFMLPVIILFFLAQRVFVEGVTLTGVRGSADAPHRVLGGVVERGLTVRRDPSPFGSGPPST